MKKILCMLFILFVCVSSMSGCALLFLMPVSVSSSGNHDEEEAYERALTDFLTALDAGDKDAIREMFSPAVRAEVGDLDEQIDRLLEIYPGPTDVCGNDGQLQGSTHIENGNASMSASNDFFLQSGDQYFWCYLDLMYRNDFDESRIGITQILFFTADEYWSFYCDEEAKYTEAVGLTVYAGKTVDGEFRVIDGGLFLYSPTERTLSVDDVSDFLKGTDHYSAFVNTFGEPNAVGVFYYYELPSENGQRRYLSLCVYEEDDSILSVDVVDELGYCYTVWDSE
ncbi:MAG: DUF5104 domain-containing protein [Eubacteriales bacterium]